MRKNLVLFSLPPIIAAIFISAAAVILLSGSGAEYGGVVVVGPIPLAFGSSAAMAVAAMLFGLALMVVFSLVSYRMLKSVRAEDAEVERESDKKVRGGGVVVIGPVPVAFGTDAKYVVYMMALAAILMALGIIAFLMGVVR